VPQQKIINSNPMRECEMLFTMSHTIYYLNFILTSYTPQIFAHILFPCAIEAGCVLLLVRSKQRRLGSECFFRELFNHGQYYSEKEMKPVRDSSKVVVREACQARAARFAPRGEG
jgi:hypothetical protein